MGEKAQSIVEEMRRKRQEEEEKQKFQAQQRAQGPASSRLLARINELKARGDADSLVIELLMEKQRELEEMEDPTLGTVRKLQRQKEMMKALNPNK